MSAVDLSSLGEPAGELPALPQPCIVIIGATLNARDVGNACVIEIQNTVSISSVPLTDEGIDEFILRLKAIRSEHVRARLQAGMNGHLPPAPSGRG